MSIKHLTPKSKEELEFVILSMPCSYEKIIEAKKYNIKIPNKEINAYFKKMDKSTTLWQKTEFRRSPLVIFVLIYYIIYYIFFILLVWPIISCVRPFTNSKLLCEKGFHKYRLIQRYSSGKTYRCIICQDELWIA
jgi:hypothetical protein